MVVDTSYYDLLEVPVDATDVVIKKSYRRLAIKYHPDKNPYDTDAAAHKFQMISEAYQVISDPHLRARYDKYGKAGAVPEKGFEDANAFFTSIFGGEAFLDIVGEISLIKDLTRAMEIAEDEKANQTDGSSSASSNTTISQQKLIELTQSSEKKRRPDSSLSGDSSKSGKRRTGFSKEKRDEFEKFETDRREKREERVAHLTKKLIERLSLWTESEKDEACTRSFKEKQRLEAENLKLESFGVEMMHAVGAVYMQKANIYIKSQKYFGFTGIIPRMKEKGQVARDIWNTISSAFDATQTVEQMTKLEEEGGDAFTPEVKALYEREASSKMLFASWRGTKLEIQDVLRRVCNRVLEDKVPKEKRWERALAMRMVAEQYLLMQPDEDDPGRVMEQLMAEARMKKKRKSKLRTV